MKNSTPHSVVASRVKYLPQNKAQVGISDHMCLSDSLPRAYRFDLFEKGIFRIRTQISAIWRIEEPYVHEEFIRAQQKDVYSEAILFSGITQVATSFFRFKRPLFCRGLLTQKEFNGCHVTHRLYYRFLHKAK